MEVSARTVLLVSGSPRAGGNTDTLLQEMAQSLEERGFTTTFAALRSYSIHGCSGCERCRTAGTCVEFLDGMHLLYPLIEQAGALVVGSPTYNYNITSEMKAFIDRCYPFFDFTTPRPGPYTCRLAGAGRKLVVVGVCEQEEESEMGFTMPAMADAFGAMGYELVEKVAVTGHFPRGAVRKDEKALEAARDAAGKLAAALDSGTGRQ